MSTTSQRNKVSAKSICGKCRQVYYPEEETKGLQEYLREQPDNILREKVIPRLIERYDGHHRFWEKECLACIKKATRILRSKEVGQTTTSRTKCKDCQRWYRPTEQLADVAEYTTVPLARDELIPALAERFDDEYFWEYICIECFRNALDELNEDAAGYTYDLPVED